MANSPLSLWRFTWLAFAAALLCVVNVRAQDSGAAKPGVQEAQELMNKTSELFKAGQFAAALPLAQRALAIREKELGPEHPDTAASLSNLGNLYLETGAYAKAKPLFQRALRIQEKALGAEHPDTAVTLDRFGGMYYEMGDYAKAEPLYQRALAIREKSLGREHSYTAKSLNNLALLYFNTGDYAKAEPLYQRALSIKEKTFGPDDPSTAYTLHNLANLYLRTGAYAKAEPFYQRTIAIQEKALGPEHPATAMTLRNLGYLYMLTGAYAKAEPLFQRALAIEEKLLGPEHPNTAVSLRYLGHLYTQTGAYAKAEPLYQRSLAVLEKVRGPEHPDTAVSLNNLANLYSQTGEYAKAEPLYQRALRIQEKALGPKHPDTASSLVDLAAFYGKTGQYAKAEPLYERALSISERAFGFDHPDTIAWLDGLAEVNWAEGEVSRAQTQFERAQRIQEKYSERFLLTGSESRKLAYLQSQAENTHKAVSFSVSVPEPKNVRLGLISVLQTKGRTLDAVADSISRLRHSASEQDRVLFERLAEVANQLSILTYRGPDQQSVDTYRQQLQELSGQQEKLEADLSKRSSEFRKQIAPITLASVTAAIPKDAVLIEWFRYVPFDPKQSNAKTRPTDARYVAYVLKRNSDPVVVDIGDAQTIESLTREFRSVLTGARRESVDASALALSEKLLKPLRKYVKGTERILISPDGSLNLLPFAALFDEQGDFLAQHHEVTYLTSARDLIRLSQTANSHREAVVIADPDFGSSAPSVARVAAASPSLLVRSADLDRSGVVFRRLSNTALEAQELKDLLKLTGSDVFLQADATESNLKQVHGPRILHIATHGFFLNDQELEEDMKKRSAKDFFAYTGENPLLRSGLALAGANPRRSGANDDGVLTSLEVAQLDLHGTELVVLSACDTGVGEVQNGEGVYGLRRSLVLAGAQTQVTTLWKVSDEATRLLMIDFYQRLLKGEGRSSALRHAQLHMLSVPEYSHPYYWASFIPIGNWTPLPN